MRKSFVLYPLLLLLFSCTIPFIAGCAGSPEYTQKFALSNAKPAAGEVITAYYLPDEYKEGYELTLKVYEYKAGLTDTKDYPFTKNGRGFTADFSLQSDSRGALLVIKNGDATDNFDGAGYYLSVHGKDGNPVPGALAAQAYAMINWADFYLELKKDDEKAFEMMKSDFEKNESIRREFAPHFYTLLSVTKRPDIAVHLEGTAAMIETAADKTEEEFQFLINYANSAKDAEKVNQLKETFKEKYPQAVYFQRAKVNEYYREQDLQKKRDLASQFGKEFPDSRYAGDITDIMVNFLRDKKMYTDALEYIKMNKSTVSAYRYYALGQRMFDEEYDNSMVIAVADMGLEKALAEYQNPTEKKDPQSSIADWKYDRGWMAAFNYFLKAQALQRKGDKEGALAAMKKNREYAFGRDDKFNTLYMNLLSDAGDTKAAKTAGEEAVLKGFDNSEIISILKTIYTADNGSENGFKEYISNLEKPGREKMMKKLSKDIINEPAPQFTLVDLSGKEVSLADYKGKTVIVDFWATWCGPCLQSFPGMQKAVDKYASDNSVKFLFINAWERVTEKQKNAEDFIAKKKYTFHVLMDFENKVISDFGVSGIPTKFILDKNGNIRFKSVGFSGNADHLVKELDAMIAMIQQGV